MLIKVEGLIILESTASNWTQNDNNGFKEEMYEIELEPYTHVFGPFSAQSVYQLLMMLKVIYHPLYSMNNFVTNKSKLPQDGAQVFPR